MFGFGISELFIFLIIIGGISAFSGKRGALGMSGPVLVLRKFEVNGTGPAAVVIEGRPSGFIAWLLTTLSLDTLTTLEVTDAKVTFKEASLSGEIHHLVPIAAVSSTHCGFSQPIWLLVFGGVLLILSVLSALGSREPGPALLGGILVALLCLVIFAFQKKIVITIETTGGLVLGLAFKPSAMEHVSINLAKALEAVDRINGILVSRHSGAARP